MSIGKLVTAFMIATSIGISVPAISQGEEAASASKDVAKPEVQQQPAVSEQAKRGNRFEQRWLKSLNLTSEQQAKVSEMFDKHRQETVQLRKQLAEESAKVRAVSGPDSFDEKGLKAALAAQAAVRSDMTVSRARLYSQIYTVLTPEQQKQMLDARKARQERSNARRHR